LKIIVTGGAGFIGSTLVRQLVLESGHHVLNVDKLTYAAAPESLADIAGAPTYAFEQLDIADGERMQRLVAGFRPEALLHLAAESHVDRSLDAPDAFIQTNVVGTYRLLEACRHAAPRLGDGFRFVHVSTDEVFGDLGADGVFTEASSYRPSSPYAASKAAADHLVRAWVRSYGFPAIVTNCSNNFGPRQFPEKLVPLIVLNALEGRELPVYGDGQQVRDWLYVEDHARALRCVLERGRVGETYNVGAHCPRTNLELVHAICRIVDELVPAQAPSARLVRHVADRPGHDRRYAIDASRIRDALGWRPAVGFDDALRATVRWYRENRAWVEAVGQRHQRQRLGLGAGT
jgi:dTDP-glucose 4,6-dehydratase